MKHPTTALIVLAAFAALAPVTQAQSAKPVIQAPDPLQPFRFLVGTWRGAGKSDAGAIQGTMTVQTELQGRVLVRRDSSQFPKAGGAGKPYEQMMVIAPSAGGVHADYWDSVGHVIAYDGTATSIGGADQAQFVSAASANVPRFRLTYTAEGPRRLHTVFEMQPPGDTAWHTIADGESVKTGGSSRGTSVSSSANL